MKRTIKICLAVCLILYSFYFVFDNRLDVYAERSSLSNLNDDVEGVGTFAEYMNLNLTRSSVINWITANRYDGLNYEGAEYKGWNRVNWQRCYNIDKSGKQMTGKDSFRGYNCTGFAWSVYYYTHWYNNGYYRDTYDTSSRIKEYIEDLYGDYQGSQDLSDTGWFAFFANDHASEFDHYCLGVNLQNDSEVQAAFKLYESEKKIAAGDLIIYWNDDRSHDIHTAIYAGNGQQYEKTSKSTILAGCSSGKYNTAVYVFPVEQSISNTWQEDSNGWYYVLKHNKRARNEYIDGYWLDDNGYRTYEHRASWNQNARGWWYGDATGWYAKNRWLKIDNSWYYFNQYGYSVTGWQRINNKWYFFQSDRTMVSNTTKKIKGIRYTFDKTGALIE